MNSAGHPAMSLRVHLTNVQGEGAVQLVASLLPALERNSSIAVGRIDLPAQGPLAAYHRQSAGPEPEALQRRLPNAVSRLVECLRPLPNDQAGTPLLVLGDIPQRSRARQTVFVHTTHLLARQQGISRGQRVKFAVMRWIFARNLRHADALIVQGDAMRDMLVRRYPAAAGKVWVVRQPPPEWLLRHRPAPPRPGRTRLRLFYPAAGYPHKNHDLVRSMARLVDAGEVIDRIELTLPKEAEALPLLDLLGHLGPEEMRRSYDATDALLFPSFSESYGLPLIEAMWLGLPIICADLPYARSLCGDEAIYFDPTDPEGALRAIVELRDRLRVGWCPDWQACLVDVPRDWDSVAQHMVAIAQGR